MAKLWYEKLHELYGKFDYYGGDLFHEGGKTAGIPLSLASRQVQKAMQKANPGAIWILQGWGSNPKASLMLGLDSKYTIVQKLHRDMSLQKGNYPKTDYGKPWTLNLINNFGGGNGIYGNLTTVSLLPELLQKPQNKNCIGLGYLCEGTYNNPVFYDLMAEVFWQNQAIDLEAWLKDYLIRRYQLQNEGADSRIVNKLQEGWKLLLSDIYHTPLYNSEGQPDSIICARPSPTVDRARSWSSGKQYWSKETLNQAAACFLEAAKLQKEASQTKKIQSNLATDLTDLFRQVLQTIAHEERRNSELLPTLITQTDQLVSTNKFFLLGNWTEAARKKGAIGGVADQYERAARQLITRWNSPNPDTEYIKDYSNRTWSGLVRDYYLPRWQLYFETVQNNGYQEKTFNETCQKLEIEWIYEDTTRYSTQPHGDVLTICQEIADSYFSKGL